MKNQKGITLVALVVTIIVLLILAGVSISLVVGQNGVLTQAQDAVLKNQAAEVREKVSMALGAAEMKYTSEWAMNQAVTRTEVFNDTAADKRGTFATQLANDGVYMLKAAPTAKIASIPAKHEDGALAALVDTKQTMNLYYKGNVYTFTVKVTKDTGAVELGTDVTIKDSNGVSKTTNPIKFN